MNEVFRAGIVDAMEKKAILTKWKAGRSVKRLGGIDVVKKLREAKFHQAMRGSDRKALRDSYKLDNLVHDAITPKPFWR